MKRFFLSFLFSIFVTTALSGQEHTSPGEMSFLDENDCKVYRTADYTPFSTMQEVFTEYVREIRFRGNHLEVLATEDDGYSYHFMEGGLFLVDGNRIQSQEYVMKLNPKSLAEIRIYQDAYVIDGERFNGVVVIISQNANN